MRPVERVQVRPPVGDRAHVHVVLRLVVVVARVDRMALQLVADRREVRVDAQPVGMQLEQLVRHRDAGEARMVVVQDAHRVAEQAPEGRVALAVRHAEVDDVGKRVAPVDPVERGDGRVAALLVAQRPHPDGVGVRVDAAVADHQLDADHVTHQRPQVRLDHVLVHARDRRARHEAHARLLELDAPPEGAGRRPVAVDVHVVDAGDVQQTEHAQVEHVVHPAAAEPHHVRDVRHELLERRPRQPDRARAVEDASRQPAEHVVQRPHVARVERVVPAADDRHARRLRLSAVQLAHAAARREPTARRARTHARQRAAVARPHARPHQQVAIARRRLQRELHVAASLQRVEAQHPRVLADVQPATHLVQQARQQRHLQRNAARRKFKFKCIYFANTK